MQRVVVYYVRMLTAVVETTRVWSTTQPRVLYATGSVTRSTTQPRVLYATGSVTRSTTQPRVLYATGSVTRSTTQPRVLYATGSVTQVVIHTNVHFIISFVPRLRPQMCTFVDRAWERVHCMYTYTYSITSHTLLPHTLYIACTIPKTIRAGMHVHVSPCCLFDLACFFLPSFLISH